MKLASFRKSRSLNAAEREELLDLASEVDAVITEVHDLSHRMHSSRLEHLGLEEALGEMCESISMRSPVRVEMEVSGESEPPDPQVALCFYRVAQAALDNVAKHSQASQARLTLWRSGGRVVMEVRDNGIGFDTETAQAGLGLASIHERVFYVHGTVSIGTRRGRGTTIKVEAPLRQPDDQVCKDPDAIPINSHPFLRMKKSPR